MAKEVSRVARKLYGNTVEKRCEYCENGQRSADGTQIFCKKRGVVQPGEHCRRYVYDPLRRVPFRQAQLKTYQPEDFSLD